MSTSGTVRARWRPLYSVSLPDGRVIGPGDEVDIPRGEAEASDHWEPVAKGSAPKKDEE